MSPHPPWLRFQAYLVGLPKTGSTSIATTFAAYRTGHEWDLPRLVELGLARRRGELRTDSFLRATGHRIVPPTLEMDSATCHHLYADLLVEQFPRAVFVHTVRDVRSWTTSLLDMGLRKRLARGILGQSYVPWEREYFATLTDDHEPLDADSVADDRAALPGLMRYWAAHLRELWRLLPAERSLRVRTAEIPDRLPALARLTQVPAASLRPDLTHSNRSPMSLDRMAVFDSDEVRATYDEHCADLMADLFPDEHRAWTRTPPRPDPAAWQPYLAALQLHVAQQVAQYGPAVTH